MKYEIFVGTRNDGTDKLRVLFVITDKGELSSEAIFDSPSKPTEMTNGRGYFFAFANINDISEVQAVEQELRDNLVDFINNNASKKTNILSQKKSLDLGGTSPKE